MSFKPISSKQIIDEIGIKAYGKFQKHLAERAKEYIGVYVPIDSGRLVSTSKIIKGYTALLYDQPYAHFQYRGIVYVDPQTLSTFAPKGGTKVPVIGWQMQYQNPLATSYWDRTMMQERGKDLIRDMQRYLDKGGS